jgi:hypothetical protein
VGSFEPFWQLDIGKQSIYLNQKRFEELKAIMGEVLHFGE